ncbi:type ISP restriction/modification enzyme [Bradyrhizobium sp.]|uniref:type ISP restriction/modification enzyme n=1 Tax=Bradyrhizobium sp. TaxID=376 RepID=UPI0025BE1CDA|nr:type ISP restriction/modification enzyme [Bradyrhizobium sp.]
MNQVFIQQYLNELSDLRRASGTGREGVVSEAFKDLLKGYAKSHDLIFIPQYELPKQDGNRRIVDGALVYDLRIPFGYWEAKDEEDNLDKEIAAKLRRGYPRDNIIFEDSQTAVLMQYGNEVTRCPVEDTEKLKHLLDLFFKYERPEVADFRKAVVQFQADLPHVLEDLRAMIANAQNENVAFRKGSSKFLKHAQETINPAVNADDVREMLIQHILTEEIFSKVFDEDDFHRNNNVAKELYALEGLFFTGALKKTTLKGLEPYYNAIRTTAHQIATHTEKQTFLKVIYEGFYKVYNKKAADRLGVVYTPNEIVRFMIESADWLCQKHFGKNLIDKGVEILDPATGTGTFICELMEHFRGQKQKLAWKYKEELHANEVAILPYYVANLNIEATYAAITGQYAEFPNLCFVDTLDNVAGLGKFSGHQEEMFGSVSEENVARIKRQNKKKISVVVGNPPYNAWQENYNNNNANRAYKAIDSRIAATYIKESKAQNKIAVYDMYTRFFRWASDRLQDDGIIAFVTNRSFIEARSFDGFRKIISEEFQFAYLIDLGGDIRVLSGKDGIFLNEENTIFGMTAAVGIAITFLVKKRQSAGRNCSIGYIHPCDIRAKRSEKFAYLESTPFEQIQFENIQADSRSGWINQTDNDFDTLLPTTNPETKSARSPSQERAIFRLVSNGVKTQRDDWVYDVRRDDLEKKVKFLIKTYEASRRNPANVAHADIKWDRELQKYLSASIAKQYEADSICVAEYRPFHSEYFYRDKHFNGMSYLNAQVWPKGNVKNIAITVMGDSTGKPYFALAVSRIPDLNFVSPASGGSQQMPRYRFASDGTRVDNITDWALTQFRSNYEVGELAKRPITKDSIFQYVYGVLYDPIYREKYAQNLTREFPRIPFYTDFWKWAERGRQLMALHTGYEAVKPWKLKRVDVPDEKSTKAGLQPKASLRADRDNGIIVLDSETQLTGVPPEAWTYRLGNRSALEWVLDQYKEKTPKDPTIREKFNSYRFADHKERVIDLLMRVTRVSVETMELVEAMRTEKRV